MSPLRPCHHPDVTKVAGSQQTNHLSRNDDDRGTNNANRCVVGGALRTIFVACGLALLGCAVDHPSHALVDVDMSPDPSGNLTVYVSNQSSVINEVDITIGINGQVAVSDVFDVANQHNWREFRYALSPGDYRVSAESVVGDAVLEADLTVGDESWFVFDYWFDDSKPASVNRHFSVYVSDRPILLL